MRPWNWRWMSMIGSASGPAQKNGRLLPGARAAVELAVDVDDRLDVEPVRKDRELARRVLAAREPPVDRLLAALDRVLRIDADTGPGGDPVGGVLQEIGGAVGVGEDDEEVALV